MHPHSTRPELTLSAETTTARPIRSALERHSGRPVYPYSVIRGGIYSVAEFDAALREDSVVSAHYAGFHRESARWMHAPASTLMYASYRIGNSVFWTSHRIHIVAGEALVADGTTLARARCGNQLSPREPVARMEPLEREMDSPVAINSTGPSLGDLPLGDLAPTDSGRLDRLFELHLATVHSSALAFELFPLVDLSAGPVSDFTETSALSPVDSSQWGELVRGPIFEIWPVALPLVPGSIKNPRQPTTTSQPSTATDEFPVGEPEPIAGNPSVSLPGPNNDVPEPVAGVLFCAGLPVGRLQAPSPAPYRLT